MRRVLIGDALAAAGALTRSPAALRARRLHRMIREATRADLYRRATGRMHPIWGDGSLMAAALRRDPNGPRGALESQDYRASLILVLEALGPYPRAQDRQVGSAGSKDSRAAAISSPHSVQ